MTASNYKEKIEKFINYLPPIPAVLVELIRALKSDDVDPNTLSRIIEKDPSMSMNVLKIANSAFYNLAVQVQTIGHAVRMLGVREITQLCISCGTSKVLKSPKGRPSIDLDQFWQHSVATGVIASVLLKRFSFGSYPDLYLAGLIHDAGIFILDQFVHDLYQKIVDLTYEKNIPLVEAERAVLGESHGNVGGWLMKKWRLPEMFVEIANYHHNVLGASKEYLIPVAIVSLADQLARLKCHGFGGDMSGVILAGTDAFKVLEEVDRSIRDVDIVKFVWDLDDTNQDILELKQIMRGDYGQ